MNKSSEHLLKVTNLCVAYNTSPRTAQPVLNGIDFSLGSAEKLGILGESGSGKSTCARAILRLLDGTADLTGQVLFEGKDFLSLSPRNLRQVRPKIQMIFQDPFSSFDPRQELYDALAEVLQVHFRLSANQIKTRICNALLEVGLSEQFLSRLPAQLSGGQLQRAAIARALLFEPKILIADEAVSALDLSLQAQIVALLSEIAFKRRMSVLFISHDLRLVRYFCDRVLILKDGRIVEGGAVEKVFVSPESQYTIQLIQAAIFGKTPSRQERCIN